jgi:ketosteroid isomerase-like protein
LIGHRDSVVIHSNQGNTRIGRRSEQVVLLVEHRVGYRIDRFGGHMTVKDEVRARSAEWDAALVCNDAPLVADFMTEDWVYVGPTGATSKADVVSWIESGRLVHHTMTVVGGERVALAADTVLLTARKASSGTWDGTPYKADEWITEVFVRTDNMWRCALSQKTVALVG